MRRIVLCVCCLIALVSVARAQVSYTGGTYTQNFNSFAGTNASLPTGWAASFSGTSTFNGTGTGTSATGGVWAYGASGNFSLGALRSATPGNITYTVTFTNNTGATITKLNLSWDYLQWRYANTSGWSASGTGALAGNATLAAATFTGSATGTSGTSSTTSTGTLALTGLSIANGATFGVQWVTTDITGSDNGVAIDNFTLDGPPAITSPPVATSATSGQSASFSVTASSSLTLTYQWRKNSSPISGNASATTANLTLANVVFADNGSSYDVIVTNSLGSTTSSPTVTLTVNKIATTVTLDAPSLTATYNGSSHAATATTNPATGVTVGFTYNGSSTAPTNAGSYTVVASCTDSEHTGTDTGTLTINPATETVSLSNLSATYDGLAHAVTVTTSPVASISTTVTYNGSATVPINAGSYAVVATISDPNYTGTASGTLTIAQASQTISFGALANHFTSDPPFTVSATATSGLAVSFSITSGSPTIATISGSTITLAGGSSTGTVTVQAAQAGNVNYTAAPNMSQSFTVALPPATINTQPTSQTVTAFQNATFTVSASVGTGSLTYQWRKNSGAGFVAITGNASALTASLTLASVTSTDAATYDVLITAPGGTVQSNPVTLTVNKAAATVTLGALSATFDGATHAATATTSPPGLAVDFTYNGSSSAPSGGGSYTVVGTINDLNYAGTATSTLVIAKASQSVAFPAPSGTLRATVPFTVSATASSGLTPVTFSIVSGNATATGPNGATITVADNVGPTVIRATQAGNANYNAAFTDVSITVSVAPVAPAFVVQPTAAGSYGVGDSAILSATVSGIPDPTFQWRKDGVALTGFPTANTASLFLAGLAFTDAGSYDLVATNSSGSATSHFVIITVAKKSQTISFDAPSGTFNAGAPVKLTATASSGLPVAFSIVSGAGSISGSTLTGFGATIVVRASQAGNATAFAAADNVDRTFTFVAGGSAPFLFSAPVDQTVNLGATVTFSAAAIGTPAPTWQWAKDGVALDGATTANLTLAAVTLADAARYTVTATNAVGAASASAQLNVRAAPAFTVSPASQSVNAGTNVTFTAAVTGFPVPTLQWRKNGIAITGAVSNNLTLVNVSARDTARYDLVATNSLGSTTSASASLTVVVRDFSGAYFGHFGGAAGDFALYVRADGTGVFIGYLPGSKTAIVATNVVVDLSGNFSLNVGATTASAAFSSQLSAFSNRLSAVSEQPADSQPSDSDLSPLTSSLSPNVAAVTAAATLHGTLNDATGALTATVPELGVTLDGARAASTGAAAAQAGFYSGALVGSADGRGYVIVGADGQAFALAASSTAVDGAKGTVGANGRLTLTTSNQSTVDLGFANGALTGTVRTAAGVTATLDGAADALAGTERLANISARGETAPGAPLIAGFVVTGTAPKQVLIRAAGPALAGAPFNVPGALDDPVLELFRGSTVVAQNDNWSTPVSAVAAINAAATSVNAFAFRAGSADAALLTTLTPGNYTVQISASTASRADTGAVLAEIYEILAAGEAPGARRLVNLSARGPVAPGAPLIAGFVINGTAPQRVLVRGIGPALAAFRVPGALPNPTLTLFHGATPIKTNDDWFRDPDAALIRDAATKTGAFALGATSLDAAILLYLDPGAYTAQVSGAANGTGIALVEIYEVP